MSHFFTFSTHRGNPGPHNHYFRKATWFMVVFFACGVIITSLGSCSRGGTFSPRPGAVYREETVILPTGAPTPEPTLANTRVLPLEVLTPALTPTITPIPNEVMGLVVEVIDGDTIAVILNGDPARQAYQVRYLGIEAPDISSGDPWGVVAYELNQRLTKLKIVRLVGDQTDFDAEGYLLRYVYVDNQLLNIVLAEQGLARAAIDVPDMRFEDEILKAEAQARESQVGLWGGQPPTPTPIPGEPPRATAEETPETQGPTTPVATIITPTEELTTSSTITATVEITPPATDESLPDDESQGQ